jgi:ABC-type enterochelin transport system permease subunit
MGRKSDALDWLDMLGAFVAVLVLMVLLVIALFHCILREERRQVNYGLLAGDMRVEAKYRAVQWLRGERDGEVR